MTPEDKLIAAIDRNTEEVKNAAEDVAYCICLTGATIFAVLFFIMLTLTIGCPRAKAAPLVSDGDEIASVGTVQVVTPHPSWAQPLEGTSWISIAQTGWPLSTWLPNGTVVSFFEMFSLDSLPSSAMVTFAADDSASLWVNGELVVAEAPTAGNAYTVCSDTGVTCTAHTTVDVLPWLIGGGNEMRFDVAQRGGWSYGLNYSVALQWLDEPPLPTPEPGTAWMMLVVVTTVACTLTLQVPLRAWWRLWSVRRKHLKARKALEE